jgi:FkbM family methyltransferase
MKIRVLLARLKRRILKKPFLKDPKYPPYWFNKLFGGKEIFIVQIGSNDGKTGDPLNELLQVNKCWKALFVEPVPYLFKRLKSNYQDSSRFQFENVAINNGEKLSFYWVDPKANESLDNLPFWYDQVGSFDKNHITKQLGETIQPFIRSEELEGLKLTDLIQRNDLNKIDVLHIDTEGYDWKILSQLDLSAFQPTFILYEMNHLSSEEMEESNQFLKGHYELFHIGIDILAVNKKVGSEITRSMNSTMKKYKKEA